MLLTIQITANLMDRAVVLSNTQVPTSGGSQVVHLNRRNIALSPTGKYHCEVLDASGTSQTLIANIIGKSIQSLYIIEHYTNKLFLAFFKTIPITQESEDNCPSPPTITCPPPPECTTPKPATTPSTEPTTTCPTATGCMSVLRQIRVYYSSDCILPFHR